jgi:hypothetical protein
MKDMKRSAPKALAAILGLLLLPGVAQAVPVFNPGNGHYYDLIMAGGPITWEAARTAANGLGGYLATLTTSGEDSFVWSQYDSELEDNLGNMAWLGGFQLFGGPSPEAGTGDALDGWTWVTGEAWSYTNWHIGEPNNISEEDYLHLGRFFEGTWNDANDGSNSNSYIVEWDSNPAVPEPGTLILLGSGLAGVALRRRSKKASEKID